MIKIEIKNRWTGSIIFTYENELATICKAVLEALKSGANLSGANLRSADLRSADLSGANLSGADLSGADLRSADLRSANLSGADLRSADLRSANLSGADLRSADLRSADLSAIKYDMFAVLLYAISEIPNIKKAIIDGKIKGSTYNGECACLCGTALKSTNKKVYEAIELIKDSDRPIERFFLSINPGDTPENSQFSKLALEWIEEFEFLIRSVI